MAENLIVQELIELPEKCTSFFGKSGRKYLVHSMISTDAYAMMQQLELEIQSGSSVTDILDLQGKAIKALQTGANVYDASVHLYNAQNATERIKEQMPTAWLLELTLFVRPEGSDLSAWDEAQALEWIADWSNTRLDSLFFCRAEVLNRFSQPFEQSIRSISESPSGENAELDPKEKSEQG